MTHNDKKATDSGITAEIVDEFLETLWIIEERGKSKNSEKSALCKLAVDEGFVEDQGHAMTIITQMA